MPVETVNYINDLNPDWPDGTEPKSQGDNHLRNTKKAIKQTFFNVAGPVSASHVELSHMAGVTAPVQGQLDARAQKSGSVYTGTHDYSGAASVKLPAATNIGPVTATELGYLDGVTSGVQAQFDGVNTTVAGKVARSGDTYSGAHNMTGATVTVTTQAVADNTTKAASTQFVKAAIADAALSSSLPGQAGNAGKFISTDGTNAFWGFADWSTQITGKPTNVAALGLSDWKIESAGSANLNTLIKPGIYRTTINANAPSNNGILFVARGVDISSQTFYQYNTGRVFVRTASGISDDFSTTQVWTDWKACAYHSENPVEISGGVMDCSTGNYFTVANISGGLSLSFSNIPNGAYSCVLEIYLASGAVTLPAGTLLSEPNSTIPAGKRFLIFFQKSGLVNGRWFASVLQYS